MTEFPKFYYSLFRNKIFKTFALHCLKSCNSENWNWKHGFKTLFVEVLEELLLKQ